MRNLLFIAIAAAFGASPQTSGAVVLNPHGTGQVLIYPYYTVNAGFSTLLSVVNTTEKGRALKVRFNEGYNGRGVLDFNLYLSPFDVWVAQVFDTGAGGAAGVATNDNSCTVPAFPAAAGSGLHILLLSSAAYSGSNADGGPTAPSRTREGYVEIIEMGTVTNDQHHTLDAITHSSGGVPSDCAQLVNAWKSGGYWDTNASADLAAPDGGLFGAESIINVGEGLLYTVNAETIDGFSIAVQHTLPGSVAPDLNTASKDANGIVTAFVPVGNGMAAAQYTNAEDAISALFMADAIYNEYVVDPGVGAATDWIVTFPTKRFYVDRAVLGQSALSRSPFDVLFSSAYGGCSVVPVGLHVFNREESTIDGSCGLITQCPSGLDTSLCYATNAIALANGSALGSSLPLLATTDVFGSFTAGHLRADLTHDFDDRPIVRHVLNSANGVTFTGVPAIGFAATNYVNGNVTPGTLANYSGAYPHRTTVNCTNVANNSGACQ